MTNPMYLGFTPDPADADLEKLEGALKSLPGTGRTTVALKDYLTHDAWGFNPRDFTLATITDGATPARAALNTAAAACVATSTCLLLTPGVYRLEADLDLSAVFVVIMPGAVLKPDNGIKVTVNRRAFPLTQCIDVSVGGRVILAGGEPVYLEYWGAKPDSTASAAGTDCYAAYVAMMNCWPDNQPSTTFWSNGGTLKTQKGGYYFSQTPKNDRCMQYEGTGGSYPNANTTWYVPAGQDGFRNWQTGLGTLLSPYRNGAGTRITNGLGFSTYGKSTSAVGIGASRKLVLDHVNVTNFAAHPVYLQSFIAAGMNAWVTSVDKTPRWLEDDGNYGNCNGSKGTDLFLAGCGVTGGSPIRADGLHLVGTDCNGCKFDAVEISSINGYTVFDGATQGNNQYAVVIGEACTLGTIAMPYTATTSTFQDCDLAEGSGTGANHYSDHLLIINCLGPADDTDADGVPLTRIRGVGGTLMMSGAETDVTQNGHTVTSQMGSRDNSDAAFTWEFDADNNTTWRVKAIYGSKLFAITVANSGSHAIELYNADHATFPKLAGFPGGLVLGSGGTAMVLGASDAPPAGPNDIYAVQTFWLNTNKASGQPWGWWKRGAGDWPAIGNAA